MRRIFTRIQQSGFTLIELLIVVAIIAILAAIAVPNFLEAQTRSKVSRCAADMRTIRTGLESYRVDTNKYPETDLGIADMNQAGCGMLRLTTPLAYITSVPRSPFKESEMGYAGIPKLCNKMGVYLYVCAAVPMPTGLVTDSNANLIDDDYERDRIAYVAQNASLGANNAYRATGYWEMKSVGPNNVDDRNTLGTDARLYDPTNGTISPGDVVVFSDSQGFAQARN
jgi:type II secretion system protein G